MELTGLQKWAAQNDCTPEEVTALLMTEQPDNWDNILWESRTGPTEFSTGRAAAIEGLLARGRDGELYVPLAAILAATGASADTVHKVLSENNDFDNLKREDGAIRSDGLQKLCGLIRQALGQPEPQVIPKEERKTAASAGKASGKRRTKYSISKAAIADLLGRDAELPVRAIRLFLLSLPDYKAQDIALMSDNDVSSVFSRSYAALSIGGGTVILPKEDCETVLTALSQGGTYYIPASEINPAD